MAGLETQTHSGDRLGLPESATNVLPSGQEAEDRVGLLQPP